MKYFDEQKWKEIIKNPLWYIDLKPEYQRLWEIIKNDPSKNGEIKERVYSFFEQSLKDNQIALSKIRPDLDLERKPIDTIVIHHTKNKPGITWRRLSAMHLLRLYTGYEGRKENQEKIFREKKPIFSNHFRENEQVFYSYHWLIRSNGECERLLNDNQIGWQAGDWDINCRSVAICIDDNIENSTPSPVVIEAIRNLIRKNYGTVSPDRIFGHREINKNTTCPGNTFLSDWKQKLISK